MNDSATAINDTNSAEKMTSDRKCLPNATRNSAPETAKDSALVLSEIIAVTPASLTIALALIFLLKSDEHTEAAQNADTPPPQPSETPVEINLRALLPGLPFDLGNDIIRLHAQDHYVEVTTTQGRSLLSEQFGDCLDRLDRLNGIHCHRSHWICLDHLRSITRKGSAYSCQLSNGDEVPISRRKYAEIKARLSATPTPS
ncbi:LytTR family DNA-binding domain-containing protein [Shimia marina]|uniref:Regulator of CO metabolism 2 n=1 Tax=Shimia marina TaxID=321267 RepID=A0A0P1F952_9RHOB|nr:LytTR family DNA-binding domain-containing protein [Shimia marina]CUH51947.1 Regulator of CO metabolism 2 [Shimia marina]SFE44942.1 LytTr DNA-binding domain-containing protein [Shimia marina]